MTYYYDNEDDDCSHHRLNESVNVYIYKMMSNIAISVLMTNMMVTQVRENSKEALAWLKDKPRNTKCVTSKGDLLFACYDRYLNLYIQY